MSIEHRYSEEIAKGELPDYDLHSLDDFCLASKRGGVLKREEIVWTNPAELDTLVEGQVEEALKSMYWHFSQRQDDYSVEGLAQLTPWKVINLGQTFNPEELKNRVVLVSRHGECIDSTLNKGQLSPSPDIKVGRGFGLGFTTPSITREGWGLFFFEAEDCTSLLEPIPLSYYINGKFDLGEWDHIAQFDPRGNGTLRQDAFLQTIQIRAFNLADLGITASSAARAGIFGSPLSPIPQGSTPA